MKTLRIALVATMIASPAFSHGGRDGNWSRLDEQEIVQEAQISALVELVGPLGETDPAKLGQKSIFGFALRWPRGKRLTVCMQHKSRDVRVLIARTATEWLAEKPAIQLDFGDMSNPNQCASPDAPYDIRIADDPTSDLSPFWSWVGTQALSHKGEWTMDLGFAPVGDSDLTAALKAAAVHDAKTRNYFHFAVLHEFGHALGALHEHQWGTCAKYLIPDKAVAEVFPSANTPALKQEALSNMTVLTRTQINEWGAVRLTKAEDPDSVMRYDFPADIYRVGAPSFCSNKFIKYASDGDLKGLRMAYPKPGDAMAGRKVVAQLAASIVDDPHNGLTAPARVRIKSGLLSGADPVAAAAPPRPGTLKPVLEKRAAVLLNQLVDARSPE